MKEVIGYRQGSIAAMLALVVLTLLASACGDSPSQSAAPSAIQSNTQAITETAHADAPLKDITAEALLVPADVPGNWCCDGNAPVSEKPYEDGCPFVFGSRQILIGPQPDLRTPTNIQGSEIKSPESVGESIALFSGADATTCMESLKRRLDNSPVHQSLALPNLGDETIAYNLLGYLAPGHTVDVRVSNAVIHIGADADDKTESYARLAVEKFKRVAQAGR